MSKQRLSVLSDDGVLLSGYYKKLKTMKKKYFVLYSETSNNVARIEYYDNEKKYKSGLSPKRTIIIKNCFNINRRVFNKHEFVIVLASKEGGFGIVMESEEDMSTWLNQLLYLQRSGEACFDFPKYDFVWQVIIQKKGIPEVHNFFGSYHICLTNKSVTFIKIGREKSSNENIDSRTEILLTTIRRCGDSQCYFYMEIGRQSSLGPGELWMETEDASTAQNMHKMILSKMSSLNEALAEPMRKRSSSATETTNLHHDKKSSHNLDITNNYILSAQSRDRCDSLPSRNRTSSECSHTIRTMPTTAIHRVLNFHASNNSPIPFSASEESVSVEDSEESVGIPYLSRSPEDVIPEEYVDDTQKHNDHMAAFSMGHKTTKSIMKKCGSVKEQEKNQDCCGNVEDKLPFSIRAYSFSTKGVNDLTKEAIANRVRAFSVGSQSKTTRICSKTSPKLFNSDNIKNDFAESSAKKSISVPVLINKNIRIDHMGDLMEIDFSKPIDISLKKDTQRKKNDCQNTTNVLPKNLNISNPIEYIHNDRKRFDNGYLEMKPITLTLNNIMFNENITNNRIVESSNHKFEQKNTNHIIPVTSKKISKYSDTNYIPLYSDDNERKIKEYSSTSINNSMSSTLCKQYSDDIKLLCEGAPCVNQDLYYASLDLPNCDNEVNTRYVFKESFSDTNIEEIKNEYAKINFDQPEASCSFRRKK